MLARLVRSATSRAIEGFMPKTSIVIAVVTTLGTLVMGIAAARHGSGAEHAAPLAAGLLAWGAGVLFCFAASMRAFDRDIEDGWTALLTRHGARPATYLAARTGGLTIVTLVLVAAGTLVTGIGATLASRDAHVARAALEGTGAGFAYAVAFSLVVAPISIATLAARGRASGYLYLLSVLVLPALVAPWTSQLVPEEWSELVSVPGALDALRESLLGAVDGLRAVRSLAVLVAVAALAALWARGQLHIHKAPAP